MAKLRSGGHVITVRLAPDDYNALYWAAAATRRTLSSFVRWAALAEAERIKVGRDAAVTELRAAAKKAGAK